MISFNRWLESQAFSAVRHGIGSLRAHRAVAALAASASTAVPTARRAAPSALAPSALESEGARLSLAVPVDRWLSIVDDAGCTVHVDEGQVWITVEGAANDAIANPGMNVELARGRRTMVSAFRHAMLTLVAPRTSRDVGFTLQQREGGRQLTIATAGGETLAQLARWFAAGGAVTRSLQSA